MEPLTSMSDAIASVKALKETLQRYKGRDRTLGRLQNALEDLAVILCFLEAADSETPGMTALKGVASHCSKICYELKGTIETFSDKSNTDLIHLAKKEGNIDEFIDTLSVYKSTIATILSSAQKPTEEFNEMLQDTIYNLELRRQHITEKTGSDATDRPTISNVDPQLQEPATEQCLQFCESATSDTTSLQDM